MKFNVGDKILVKTWNEMLENERVQLDHRGDLYEKGTSYSFNKDMKKFCGRMAVILSVSEKIEFKLFFDEFEGVEFLFRDWMMEAEDKTIKVFMVTNEER